MNQKEKNRYWIVAEFWAMCERREVSLSYAATLLGVHKTFLFQIKSGKCKASHKIVYRMAYLLYIEKLDFSRLT